MEMRDSWMTLGEIYRQGKGILSGAGNEAPAFDADCLFQKAFGLNRQRRVVNSNAPADDTAASNFMGYIAERASGRPLQYILGKWPFMELELNVGEGVLIPREETELLVYTAAQLLRNVDRPGILDLCAGTGAVALGLASLLPHAVITTAELYDEAFSYLNRNIKETGYRNVAPLQLDVLNPQSAQLILGQDCIVSNPPYVEKEVISTLQTEVRREPCTALDGGTDGLDFYRAIAHIWLPKLKQGGVAAVEVGEGQAVAVSELFGKAGLAQIQIHRDFNEIERVVAGIWEK